MPIYMDRHQVEGVTRQQVADEHIADLKVQDKYDVNFMTYWFDDERGEVFCLVDAPNMSAFARHMMRHMGTSTMKSLRSTRIW